MHIQKWPCRKINLDEKADSVGKFILFIFLACLVAVVLTQILKRIGWL